jgi:hypothetical protein
MSSFVETTLLECNRLASEEGKTNNNIDPSLFTNKLGSGIKLNAGDSVSLHSAFISQEGAGGDTIQFSGKTLTDVKGNPIKITLSNTSLTKTSACFTDPPNASNTDHTIKWGDPLLIFAQNVSQTYVLKDNEVNVKISYYKTRNGELSIALPRRFMNELPIADGTRHAQWDQDDSILRGLPFKGISEAEGGVLSLEGRTGTDSASKTGINQQYWVEDDYIYNKSSQQDTDNPTSFTTSYFKLKNDNSRFKIYTFANPTGLRKGGLTPSDWYDYESPAESKFIPYEEVIKLTAPTGFSSPQSIADSLTNQLRQTGSLEEEHLYEYNNSSQPHRSRVKRPVSVFTESKTYKTFNTMSMYDHNASTYFAFYNACLEQNGLSDSFMFYNQYIQNYQFIGIKRPDYYDAGMELSDTFTEGLLHNGYTRLLHDINVGAGLGSANGRFNASIVLNHEWTTTNLNAWKKWLDTQGNYPELFSNQFNNYSGITTINNSRFLHMNLNACANASGKDMLGGDNVYPLSGFTGQLANQNASSQNSVPLFFDFDPSASNTFTEGNEGDPCYGFAYKRYIPNEDKYVISFSTSGLGNTNTLEYTNSNYTDRGIPIEYAYYSGLSGSGRTNLLITGNYQSTLSNGSYTQNNASGRVMGFDKHFNAFGNCMCALGDGMLNTDYQLMTHFAVNTMINNFATQSTALIDTAPFSKKAYLGSQEPQVNFNASNNKFSLSQLHTPEYIGNLWNSGINSETESNNTTTNPNSQEKVFHINKRILNNNFTTDMIPYSQNYASDVVSSTPNNTASQKYIITPMNRAISPWTVFDAQSGITIESMGISADVWDKSLWGILGFSYNQFHSSTNSNFNYNTRINEINKENMAVITTNCDVNAGDTMNFITNVFGATLMTSQVPLGMVFNGLTAGQTPPFVDDRYVQSYPAITESQKSVELVASNLPIKMTRAYYTIKTSLLDKYTYLGSRDSGQLLNTIGVVNKMNNVGDYFFQEDQGLQFLITNPKTITEIQTQILEPDGSSAQVNNDSCVIYKVLRNIRSTLNPVEELLENTKPKI